MVMSAIRTARDRARDELTREIKDAARRQLAEHGTSGLSLRAVSRELGMVSSALYRYFPSRDDLLTALIIDAYNALGDAVESAATTDNPRIRWRDACHAVRSWARENPHQYALLYGTPIPGYRAPQDTVTPASRVPLVLMGAVADSWKSGTLGDGFAGSPLSPELASQAQVVAGLVAPGIPDEVIVRAMVAWTQLFGMISFELFGQLVGSADPADAFFAHTVDYLADVIGLP